MKKKNQAIAHLPRSCEKKRTKTKTKKKQEHRFIYMALATTSNRFVILYTDINRQQLVLPMSKSLAEWAKSKHTDRPTERVTYTRNAVQKLCILQTTSSYQPYHIETIIMKKNKKKKMRIDWRILSLPCFLYSSKFIFNANARTFNVDFDLVIAVPLSFYLLPLLLLCFAIFFLLLIIFRLWLNRSL